MDLDGDESYTQPSHTPWNSMLKLLLGQRFKEYSLITWIREYVRTNLGHNGRKHRHKHKRRLECPNLFLAVKCLRALCGCFGIQFLNQVVENQLFGAENGNVYIILNLDYNFPYLHNVVWCIGFNKRFFKLLGILCFT